MIIFTQREEVVTAPWWWWLFWMPRQGLLATGQKPYAKTAERAGISVFLDAVEHSHGVRLWLDLEWSGGPLAELEPRKLGLNRRIVFFFSSTYHFSLTVAKRIISQFSSIDEQQIPNISLCYQAVWLAECGLLSAALGSQSEQRLLVPHRGRRKADRILVSWLNKPYS